MKTIIIPGWGVPIEQYESFNHDAIIDFGFFNEDTSAIKPYAVTKFDPINIDDILEEEIFKTENSVIIAHSLGSLFALRASQIPENIKAIVLIGGFAKFTKIDDEYPDGKPESGIIMMKNMLNLSPQMVLNKFYAAMSDPEELTIKSSTKCNAGRLKSGLDSLKNYDNRSILNDIDIPILIIHGDSDQIVSLQLGEYLNKNLRNSQIQIIKDAGHALPFTHFNECNALINDFLAKNTQ
jgi:pimeloyl-ACP methyl ester carboxylesterase